MPPLLLDIFESPVFGIFLFVLFFALASLVVGMAWLIIYLCKLMGHRWNQPAEVETLATATRRAAALLLLVPITFLLIAMVLVINKAASWWAGIS
jgi:hypothetical protein